MSDPTPPAVSEAMRDLRLKVSFAALEALDCGKVGWLDALIERVLGPIASEIARLTELQQRTHGRLMNWEARAEAAEAETARLRAALEAFATRADRLSSRTPDETLLGAPARDFRRARAALSSQEKTDGK